MSSQITLLFYQTTVQLEKFSLLMWFLLTVFLFRESACSNNLVAGG